MNRFSQVLAMMAFGAASTLTTLARGDYIISFDLTGMTAVGGFLTPGNSQQTAVVNPGEAIVDVSWADVSFESFDPSWMSEVTISLSNSDGSGFWDFTMTNVDAPGIYSGSGNVMTMVEIQGGPFNVLADGILRLVTYDSFLDSEVSPNARFIQGNLNITISNVIVPEPSGVAVVGFVLAGAIFRRKRLA